MLAFFLSLTGIALILGLVGWVMLLVAGFRHSGGWLVGMIFGGWIAGLIFSLVHWEDAKSGFLTCLAAFLLGISGIYGSRDYLVAFVKEQARQEMERKQDSAGPSGSSADSRVFAYAESSGPSGASTTMQKFRAERIKIGEEAGQLEIIRKNIAERTKAWATMTPEERKALKNDATAYNQRNATIKARALELDGLEVQARMLEETKIQVERERERDHHRAESQLVMYSLTTCGACKAKKQELRAAGIPFREVFLDTDSAGSEEFDNLLRQNNIAGGSIGVPSFACNGKLIINNPSISEIRDLLADSTAAR